MWAKSGRFTEAKKDYIPGPGEYDVATPKKTRGGVSFGIGDRFKDKTSADGSAITLESLLLAQNMDPKVALCRIQETANKMFGKGLAVEDKNGVVSLVAKALSESTSVMQDVEKIKVELEATRTKTRDFVSATWKPNKSKGSVSAEALSAWKQFESYEKATEQHQADISKKMARFNALIAVLTSDWGFIAHALHDGEKEVAILRAAQQTQERASTLEAQLSEMQCEMQRLQEQCNESRAASQAASTQLDAIHNNVSSLAEAVGLGECEDMSIDEAISSITSCTRDACSDLVTSRALAVVSQSSHRSLSLRLSALQSELETASATCAAKSEEAEHWEACLLDAEEQLQSERVRARQLQDSHDALQEQVEFLKDQEQQRRVSLLASLSPVASPSAAASDPETHDRTLALLADHILDARGQVVDLKEHLISANERVMLSEAMVEELKQQSLDLVARKSSFTRHIHSISTAAASAASAAGVFRVSTCSPVSSPGSIMSPATRDTTNVLKSAVCSLAVAGERQMVEKQELEIKLRSCEEQLREAEDGIVELKQSVNMWQELCQTLRDENGDLAAQVEAKTQSFVELEAEAVKRQMTLQADVSKLQEQLLSLQRELLSTQDNLSLSSSALQESVARNEGLDSELAFLNARVDEASTQISELQGSAVQSAEEISVKDLEIAALSSRVADLQAEIEQLGTAASEAEAAAQAAHAEHLTMVLALQSDVEAREQQHQISQAQLEASLNQIQVLNAAVAAADESAAGLRLVRGELEDHVATLEASVASQSLAMEEKDREMSVALQDLEATQQALADLVEERNELKQQSDGVAAQLQEAKSQYKTFCDKTKAKIEQKDMAIDALTLQVSQHIEQNAESQQQLERALSRIAAQVVSIEQLQRDFENEKAGMLRELECAEVAAAERLQQYASSISGYETQLATLQETSELQLQQQRAAAAEVAQQLSDRLQTTMQSLSDAEKVVDAKQQETETMQQQMQEQEQRIGELEGVAQQQQVAICELEAMLETASQESAAQQEEHEQLLRCLDTAGDISAMKDEKAILLQQALENTERLLQARDEQVSQVSVSLSQAQESNAIRTQTIETLQSGVTQLQSQLAAEQAVVLQLQETLELKENAFNVDLRSAAAGLAESNAQLQALHETSEERKAAVEQLQHEVSAATDAAEQLKQEQVLLVQCIAAAEDLIALKNEKAFAFQEQLSDMERMFAAAAQAAAELEQELEQVTSLADVTQLQLDTATAEAEAAAQEHMSVAAQLNAAVAKSERLQLEASDWSLRLRDEQEKSSEQQQAAAAAAAECAALSETLAAKESELNAATTRADSLVASVERLQQLLRDVQDSASAAEQRSNVAEELAREMYSHTQASVSVKSATASGSDDAVHELRGQVAALQQELQERAKEQIEWLHEMDGMRRLIQERDALAANDRAALDKVSRLHDEGSKVIAALQTEVQRLTEENVHLVGHTNLKQKIQMHAKVKDENQKQKVALAKLEGDLVAKDRTVKRLQQELDRLRGGSGDRENATPVNFSEEERLRVVLHKKDDEARRVRSGLHALLSKVGEVQAMLVKDASAAAVGPCDDGGDDDDARSCDSISGEKPQAACDDAEQMQRCSSSFGAVAAAVAKLQAEYQDAQLKLRLLERESSIMKRLQQTTA